MRFLTFINFYLPLYHAIQAAADNRITLFEILVVDVVTVVNLNFKVGN